MRGRLLILLPRNNGSINGDYKGLSMILSFRMIIFCGLFGICGTFSCMEQPRQEINVFDLIKEEHLSAIDDSTQKTPFRYKEKNDDGTLYDPTPEEFIRSEFEGQLYKPFSAQFSQACGLIKDSGYFSQTHECLKMDGATREDLKILRGAQKGRNLDANQEQENNESDCLANKVNRTSTSAGRVVLCYQLARPPASPEQLLARNLKINALLKLHTDSQNQSSLNPSFDSLETHLKDVAAGESIYLSFFDPIDNFAEQLRRSKRTLLGSKKLTWIKKFETWLNDNPLFLYWQEAEPIIMSAPGMAICGAVKVFDLGNIFFGPNKIDNCLKFCKDIGIEAINPMDKQLVNVAEKFAPKTFVSFLKGIFGAKGLEQQIHGIANTRFMLTLNLVSLKYMRKKLHHASKILCALNNTQAILHKLRRYDEEKMLVDLQMPQSDKAKETIELLSSSTFKEDHDGLWLVHWGKIKLAYKRMCETKEEFRKPYAALGELDYLIGSARLIIDNAAPLIRDSGQHAKYCLPSFITEAQTPLLKETNGWNPFIKEGQRVVLNDVELGSDGKKMLIITGPNRQGKTVYMNMILYGALMSQALGVAPAQEFSHTPYNHLVTFMKTETDTSKGESLFVNTCKRSKVCMDILRNGNGFKLFGTDEPFNGTKHLLAQSTVDEYIKKIGSHPNVNGMITTHLKAITRLPASYPIYFTNLKVDNHRVQPGIGYCENEAEGLRIIREELGQEFADAVKNNMNAQAVYEYWEHQDHLDNLVQAARQEYRALRQQAGAPTLDGIIADISDPELRAELDRKINNPSNAAIDSVINRLRDRRFDKFFDLVGHVAHIGQLSTEIQQQTFKDLILIIMAHCADATASAHSAPWLERIRQVEANIAQEHERRLKVQQEIEALQHVRNNQSVTEQLESESSLLIDLSRQTSEKLVEVDDLQRELNLRKNLRTLQFNLSQQNIELDAAILEAQRLIESLQTHQGI